MQECFIELAEPLFFSVVARSVPSVPSASLRLSLQISAPQFYAAVQAAKDSFSSDPVQLPGEPGILLEEPVWKCQGTFFQRLGGPVHSEFEVL